MISKYILVPSAGCDAISSRGTCYSYFTSTGINWADARLQCVSKGYDLATISSSEENTLAYNTSTGVDCWLGLHDIDTEGMYVWADGSSNSYRNWGPGQPDNSNEEDCVHLKGDLFWNDLPCTNIGTCYYCGSIGKYWIV